MSKALKKKAPGTSKIAIRPMMILAFLGFLVVLETAVRTMGVDSTWIMAVNIISAVSLVLGGLLLFYNHTLVVEASRVTQEKLLYQQLLVLQAQRRMNERLRFLEFQKSRESQDKGD